MFTADCRWPQSLRRDNIASVLFFSFQKYNIPRNIDTEAHTINLLKKDHCLVPCIWESFLIHNIAVWLWNAAESNQSHIYISRQCDKAYAYPTSGLSLLPGQSYISQWQYMCSAVPAVQRHIKVSQGLKRLCESENANRVGPTEGSAGVSQARR